MPMARIVNFFTIWIIVLVSLAAAGGVTYLVANVLGIDRDQVKRASNRTLMMAAAAGAVIGAFLSAFLYSFITFLHYGVVDFLAYAGAFVSILLAIKFFNEEEGAPPA